MFGFFAPKYVKEARDLLKNAHKLLCYKKDVWSAATLEEFEGQMKKLADAIKTGEEKPIVEEGNQLDALAGKFSPPPKDASLRENCEVLLVAIIIAVGVRSYFLQPFAIPTGSMQPTLNGIIAYPTEQSPPNPLARAGEMVLRGRSYVDVVCKADGMVVESDIKEYQWMHFFTRSSFECGGVTYTVNMPRQTLDVFLSATGWSYKKGDHMARGYVDAGDHVFVDKFTYNFRLPRHGEVFVFNTLGIPTGENTKSLNAPSQFYIKRLGGLPGDELRIDPPFLYQNDVKASEPGYLRVMSAKDGYHGYQNGVEDWGGGVRPLTYLTSPKSTFSVPEQHYFALGDNSLHSSDSRDWGTVPQRNIAGKGLFVFWPFRPHWGLIQ
jgi:signal peptidase I